MIPDEEHELPIPRLTPNNLAIFLCEFPDAYKDRTFLTVSGVTGVSMPFVYLITCLPTGKYYVGKTSCALEIRWRNHKTVAKRKKLKGLLQNSLTKYGVESHVIEVLASAGRNL